MKGGDLQIPTASPGAQTQGQKLKSMMRQCAESLQAAFDYAKKLKV